MKITRFCLANALSKFDNILIHRSCLFSIYLLPRDSDFCKTNLIKISDYNSFKIRLFALSITLESNDAR